MKGFEEAKLSDDNLLDSIRQRKEHMEKGIDNLLDQFSEKNKIHDVIRQMGSSFNQRFDDFRQLQSENNELRLETRKLHEQLSILRNSLQESGWKEEDINRFSVDRGKPESTFNFIGSQPSARDSYKSRLAQVEKLKQQSRREHQEQFSDYDELMKSVLNFLEILQNTKDLVSQIKENEGEGKNDSEDQMVLVPRRRYQLLIEMYAGHMADVNAQLLQKKLEEKGAEKGLLNLSQQKQEAYKEKYETIVKDQKIQILSMHVFFKKLSQRLGFEKQWERYHSENEQQAIRLKNSLESILMPNIVNSPSKMENKENNKQEKDQSSLIEELRSKLDQVVEVLPFKTKEKQCWLEVSQKIRKDQLFSMDKLIDIIKNEGKEKENVRIEDFVTIMNSIFGGCVDKFQQLLLSKYKKGIFQKMQIETTFAKETLRNSFTAKIPQNNRQILTNVAKQLSQEVIQKIFTTFKKQLVFISNRQLHSSLKVGK